MRDEQYSGVTCDNCGPIEGGKHMPTCGLYTKQETNETLDLTEVEKLESDQDILESYKLVRREYGWTEEETEQESENNASKWMNGDRREVEKRKEQELEMHFYGIHDSDTGELVASGSLDLIRDSNGRKRAHLSKQIVKKGLRKKDLKERGIELEESLGNQLTNSRIEKAKEGGAEYLHMWAKMDNPVTMKIKFGEGFQMTRIADKNNVSEMTRELDEEKSLELVDEKIEIKLDQVTEITSLINSKEWVGIGIRNDEPDQDGNKPERWTLILQGVLK